MKKRFAIGAIPIMSLAVLSSCIDDNYDLSDIDTTSEIKVTDLVIPINLDVVTLGDIITVDNNEDDVLREVTIGNETFYAVNKRGEFHSQPIHVPGFTTPKPNVNPTNISFGGIPQFDLNVDLPPIKFEGNVETSVSYHADNIDQSIVSISALYVKPAELTISFQSYLGPGNRDTNISLSDVSIKLFKGFIINNDLGENTKYDKETGVLTVKNLTLLSSDENALGEIKLNIAGLERSDLYNNHTLDLNETIALTAATLNIHQGGTLPSELTLSINYDFPSFDFTAFSGEVQYDIDGINIDPVVINDLPDFLTGDQTNLVLANPQIYLSLNNPVETYGLPIQAGLSITPLHSYEAGPDTPLTLDDGIFVLAPAPGIQNFVLSPEMPSNPLPDFAQNLKHEPFTSLSNVIAGPGIPKELYLDLVKPQILPKAVDHFLLDTNLDPVDGTWEFLAPLALKEVAPGQPSKIVYTDRETGWNDEDIDDITITKLSLTMTADSNLPLSATLSGTPLDVNGNAIPGVTIKPVHIQANTDNQQIELTVEGTVTHLDGFEFTATVESSNGIALSPKQTIKLSNIRARVSGSYIREL